MIEKNKVVVKLFMNELEGKSVVTNAIQMAIPTNFSKFANEIQKFLSAFEHQNMKMFLKFFVSHSTNVLVSTVPEHLQMELIDI